MADPFHILGQASGPGISLYSERPGTAPRISSILIKPASAVCNLDCQYCFYLDRDLDPYADLPQRRMSIETLERLVDSYLFYSYPNSTFAFQGGEPTLAGLPFFEKLIAFQKQYGRDGQSVSNALQTNGVLLDDNWSQMFREYNWLIGLSLDGPEDINDKYRYNKEGHGTFKWVMRGMESMKKNKVDFNILCVLSQANVEKPRELYRFYKSLGVDNIQYIPLAEFQGEGKRLPFTITPEQYGKFLVETFEEWWPDRRRIRIRCFDNTDTWAEIARRNRRYSFAEKKSIAHPECQVCEYQSICHGGCPKFRHGPKGSFADLDYFCQSYKMIFDKAVAPLQKDLTQLLGRDVVMPGKHSISPY
jgi:uncharacterized protein